MNKTDKPIIVVIRSSDGMIYREEIKDLFSVPNDYYLAHCISADFAMGKGIVV